MSDQAIVDAEKVALIEESFATLGLHNEAFTRLFYENLFAARPDFKPLFTRSSPDEQESKLHKTLMLAAQNLRKPDMVRKHFVALGQRHSGEYQVSPDYYTHFVAALLKTFAEQGGAKWTPELAAAWKDALDRLAEIMQSAGAT